MLIQMLMADANERIEDLELLKDNAFLTGENEIEEDILSL